MYKRQAVHNSLHQSADIEEADLILEEELDCLLVGTVGGAGAQTALLDGLFACLLYTSAGAHGVDLFVVGPVEVGAAGVDEVILPPEGGTLGLVPVSYTHLDVYKRQLLARLKLRSLCLGL